MPRAGLSPQAVVAEAAEVVDVVGYDGLTLTAVAERARVAVPSLYKHVAGLDDLRQRLAAHALAELGRRLTTAVAGKARGEAVHALAGAYRSYAADHPGRYAATQRAADPEHVENAAASQAVLDTVLAVLAGYGLVGDDAIDATRALRSALHGFVTLEATGGFGLPHDVDRSYVRMVDALDAALDNWD